MTSGSRELSPAEIVDVAEKLAHIAAEANIDPAGILLRLGLSTAKFKLGGTPAGVWLDIVRAVHAGASKTAGYRADAIARLLEKVAAEVQGNAELNELAFQLGQRAQQPVAGAQSVFLSYAHANQAAVDRLYDELHAARLQLDVFQDHRSLLPGQDWLTVLRNRAGSASLLICWVTSDYLKSAFCNYEIGVAESRGATVIPLFAEASSIGLIPAYLSRPQGIQVGDPPDFAGLAGQILVLLH
jgi:hypothetical protein